MSIYLGKYQPQYIMTDDSAIEQRAIRLAFPGLNTGEQEVTRLLCSVHSNRTLLRHSEITKLRVGDYTSLRLDLHPIAAVKTDKTGPQKLPPYKVLEVKSSSPMGGHYA